MRSQKGNKAVFTPLSGGNNSMMVVPSHIDIWQAVGSSEVRLTIGFSQDTNRFHPLHSSRDFFDEREFCVEIEFPSPVVKLIGARGFHYYKFSRAIPVDIYAEEIIFRCISPSNEDPLANPVPVYFWQWHSKRTL